MLTHTDTLAEQGAGYIIVNSYDRGDGAQFAAASAPTSADGCWFNWSYVGTPPVNPLAALNPCGVTPAYETNVPNELMPNPTSATAFYVLQRGAGGMFQLRLDFGSDPCV